MTYQEYRTVGDLTLEALANKVYHTAMSIREMSDLYMDTASEEEDLEVLTHEARRRGLTVDGPYLLKGGEKAVRYCA